MELNEILDMYKSKIDVWIVLDAGRFTRGSIFHALGKRANMVYFTPEFSHKTPYRMQKLEGDINPKRPVVISDIGFWTGKTLEETLGVVKDKGYNPNDIYGYFLCGYTGVEKMDSSRCYQVKIFEKADKTLEIIKENNEIMSRK